MPGQGGNMRSIRDKITEELNNKLGKDKKAEQKRRD